MANEQNLIPASQRTPSERREIAIKAGIASGESRRNQKTLKEMFKAFGESEPNKILVTQLEKLGIKVEKGDTMMDCLFKWAGVKTVEKSTKMGDLLKFFEVFAKYTGQEPAQKHELTGKDGEPIIKYIDPKEYKEVQDHIDHFIGDTKDD